jgi:hypothetical protein
MKFSASFSALSDVSEEIQDALVLFLTSSLAEYIPESQRFISSAGYDRFSVRTQRKIKHPI